MSSDFDIEKWANDEEAAWCGGQVVATLSNLPEEILSPIERYCFHAHARLLQLEAQLAEIANIAHHGALLDKGMPDIRRLTLEHWDREECARLQKATPPQTGEE